MRRDDRDDPFDDIFDEIERMLENAVGPGGRAGFGGDTHVDVHETEDEIRVVADLPGVEKEDLSITCDGRRLTISADGADRRYDERIDLPAAVDERSASASYNNGVLEVVLQKRDDSADIQVD